MKILRNLLKFLFEFLTEGTGQLVPLFKGNRRVWEQIHRSEKCKPTPELPLFDQEVLLRHLSEEQTRRQIIEDKSKTNILGITLAFTVILATVALAPRIPEVQKDIPNWGIWAFMALQLYGILSLLAGGVLALKTLRVARNYMWTLQDERTHVTMEAKNAEISWYLQSNQLVSLLKTNFLDASYSCIRNGVVALAISAILVLIFLVGDLQTRQIAEDPTELRQQSEEQTTREEPGNVILTKPAGKQG